MKQLLAYWIIFFTSIGALNAKDTHLSDSSYVSVLTCSPGPDLYSAFGHSALRIKDPINGIDLVYNYGTYNFNQPNFYGNFFMGKLEYYLSINTFEEFKYYYIVENRGIKEQILNLDLKQRDDLFKKLAKTYASKERYYLYDFFYNNCSTILWDLINESSSNEIKLSAKPTNKRIMHHVHSYIYEFPWGRWAIDLLLGLPSYKIADNKTSMFLPENLLYQLDHSQLGNKPFVIKSNDLLIPTVTTPHTNNRPIYWSVTLFLIIILSHLFKLYRVEKATYVFLLFFSISVSFILAFLWIFTDHQAAKWNEDLLWCLPFPVFYFFHKNIKYASIILYILFISQFTLSLFEIIHWSFLLFPAAIIFKISSKR